MNDKQIERAALTDQDIEVLWSATLHPITFAAAIEAEATRRSESKQDEFEVRADGVRARKDRWEVGIRRITALLWGNRHAFEVDEVVEAVARLIPAPFNDGDDEGLVRSVLGRVALPPSLEPASPEVAMHQCCEHGQNEWNECSAESYGVNMQRYKYRKLYASPPRAR